MLLGDCSAGFASSRVMLLKRRRCISRETHRIYGAVLPRRRRSLLAMRAKLEIIGQIRHVEIIAIAAGIREIDNCASDSAPHAGAN
jgi:hypothetical protein